MTGILIILFNLVFMINDQPTSNLETATFGSGCFWCSEAIFSRVEGVIKVVPGYSGGTVVRPSYREVCEGTTGHAEVVQITYDKSKISYPQLLEIFFKTHDPTSLNKQGADVGTQYRSVIFYHTAEQHKIAEEIKKELDKQKIWNSPIVTAIEPFSSFYEAEDYHYAYYEKNPNQGYCQFVITPKVKQFEMVFQQYLKKSK